jgi:DNA-directed RNA polymerase subunit RPC12/RpoP
MSNKCEICKEELETTFLGKIKGTIIKEGSGENSKKYYVCATCQKEIKGDIKKHISNKDLISNLYSKK